MSNNKTIQVETIIFESNDDQVLVKGKMQNGHLAYSSDIIITHSSLNKLLSQIQSNLPNFDLDNYMQAEKLYDDQTLYTIDLKDSYTKQIDLSSIQTSQMIRQIRA